MSDSGNKLRLTFLSAGDLTSTSIWNPLLEEIESCLGVSLTHLDDRDPVRKKVGEVGDLATFICAFGPKETSRRLHGKYAARSARDRIEVDISLFKGINSFPCSMYLYLPETALGSDEGVQTVLSVFEIGNKHLNTFYSIGDFAGQISRKRRADGSSVDPEVELLGMFWLTYLHANYVDFWGADKFRELPVVKPEEELPGVLLRFGERPGSEESIAARAEAETILGAQSFVDPTRVYGKPKGKYVLTYEELRD